MEWYNLANSLVGFNIITFCSEEEYDYDGDLPNKMVEARFIDRTLFTLELDPDNFADSYMITCNGDKIFDYIGGGYDEVMDEFLYVLELYAKEHPALPSIKVLL